MPDSETGRVLEVALGVFLASGFHAATIGELEAAPGVSWEEIISRYSDKERFFFAAIERRLEALSEGNPEPSEAEAVAELLRRVSNAGASVMLRAQHREALQRLTALAEAAARR